MQVGEIGEIQENGVVGEVFKSSDFDLENISAYFDCAKALESRARPGQPVMYYLISDSLGECVHPGLAGHIPVAL